MSLRSLLSAGLLYSFCSQATATTTDLGAFVSLIEHKGLSRMPES